MTHKSNYTLRGIHLDKVSQLPHNSGMSRKDELLKWLIYHGVPENFVIIDDDKSLNELPRTLKDRLILTS